MGWFLHWWAERFGGYLTGGLEGEVVPSLVGLEVGVLPSLVD